MKKFFKFLRSGKPRNDTPRAGTADLREEFHVPRFRALIIGRPNAGKTTILRCIAQAADGRVDPSSGRGIHDIKDELVFDSNPGFVFHDSRGIEAGSTSEMDTIQAFISQRANATSMGEKLHAIWYCIATDTARLLTAAELQFFDQINPDGVPVILIFTKFETQEAEAFRKLQSGKGILEALAEAPATARAHFEQEHLSRFTDRKYPPKEIVYLKNMHEEDAQCSEIIELTTKALSTDTLKQLLVTVQQTNIKLQIEYMLASVDTKKALNAYRLNNEESVKLAEEIWKWFLHLV